MSNEILVIKTSNRSYKVTLFNCDRVTESELPCLLGKASSDVWRWARSHLAKVYNGEFLPPNFVR